MEMQDYLRFSSDKTSFFYSKHIEKNELKPFKIPHFDPDKWNVYSDDNWTNLIYKEKDFPDQGWKIHITVNINEAASLLYDVAEFLIENQISFKYVPNLRAWTSKNAKYANRGASGKFITVYPENDDIFIRLLNDLKEITKPYKLGPYILNDQQWQESNVFFRYGGLKRIIAELGGEKVLAIRTPDGSLIPDERVPYYKIPDFVSEPNFIKENNYFPSKDLFSKLNQFKIVEAIHHSNAGGVYLAEVEGEKVILKEGRHKAGIDGNGKDGFGRNRNEYNTLKRLKKIDGVINARGYFTAWRHNYIIEDFHTGRNLRTFISQEFPYVQSNDKNEEYAERCIIIINQLKGIIEDIHEKGIAMGDLSLTNIMISDKDLKVTLIDFEAASSPVNSFLPGIATPGFISSEAKNFMEADWFAFYRIVRFLFLPIIPINDIAPQINSIHDRQIEKKFGDKVIYFIRQIENSVSKYTNIQPQSPFLNYKLSMPAKELSIKTISYISRGLQKGIINNLDVDSFSLIKGNIKQYADSVNKYNIAYGSFGVILSLIRSDDGIREFINVEYKGWFDLVIPFIEKESKNLKNNFGLFNGFSGIVTVLYELGYESSALLVLENILENFTEDEINITDDISIYSGLSGIGLLYLSFYNIYSDENLLKNIDFKRNRIISIYNTNIEDLRSNSDFGLLTGWSGAALFLFKYDLIMGENASRQIAFDIVDKSFESANEKDEYQGELFIVDNSRGFERLIPYLENGSSGLALTMLEFQREDENYLNESRRKVLESLITSNHLFCSVNAGLMSGYGGLLPLASAVKHTYDEPDMLISMLDNMNNYLVRNDYDEILFPGEYGFKCSMDISSGAAGILLILSDVTKNRWGSWLPLPYRGMDIFTTNTLKEPGSFASTKEFQGLPDSHMQ